METLSLEQIADNSNPNCPDFVKNFFLVEYHLPKTKLYMEENALKLNQDELDDEAIVLDAEFRKIAFDEIATLNINPELAESLRQLFPA